MNQYAADRHRLATAELETLCAEIERKMLSDEIYKVQRAWAEFKEAEAERQTQRQLGGSIRPMIYSMAAEEITRARIKELKNWLENRND
jgi:uncharacterized protein YecT (DUF1311 family)